MHMLGPRSIPGTSEAAAPSERRDPRSGQLQLSSGDNLPLAFPMARWLSFDVEERSRFNRAQLVLDAMEAEAPNSVGTLARETGLEHQDLGEALALLEDLALVEFADDDGRELSVSLVATPEEHIGVRFPDGRVRWIFISRPVVEPELAHEELN
jgi:MarR family